MREAAGTGDTNQSRTSSEWADTDRSSDQALILAAGVSRRMGLPDLPKCMLPLAEDDPGHTFLQRHIDLLRKGGIEDVAVVLSRSAAERKPPIDGATVVVSPFDTSATGSPLSVLCGLRALDPVGDAGVLISDADIVYERALLHWILDRRERSSVFVTPRIAGDEEEVRVYGEPGGSPKLIGKGLPATLTGGLELLGESLGIVYVAAPDRSFVQAAAEWLAGWPSDQPGYGYAKERSEHEEVWQYAFSLGRIGVESAADHLLLSECDTPEDYRRVLDELYPEIRRRDAEAGADREDG